MNKKIAIIGTVGLPSKYGGFETLTEYLTKYLGNNFDITVYCSAQSYNEKVDYYNNSKMEYINLKANGIQSIPYDIISIMKGLRYADTLVILGVSGCIILPFIKFFKKKKIIVNIDGLEWKREKWNKYAKWFLKFSEKLAVNNSDIVVTDNKVIQNYVLSEYNLNSELITYGGDHVKKVKISDNIFEKFNFLRSKYAFTVCRIEPENNIHIILEAMSHKTTIPLVIIGNWDASEYGRKLKSSYLKYKNIYLINPIYDQTILNQIRSNCYIYLHGHSAGGTNPSLVEAMALELSIFAFDIDYNRETTSNKAIYFSNSKDLEKLVKNTNSDILSTIAKDMKKIADEKYTWKLISTQYSNLF